MKITLRTTHSQWGEPSRDIEIESGTDDMTALDVWNQLLHPAMIAMGFSQVTIDSIFDKEEGVAPKHIKEEEPPTTIDLAMKWQTRDGRKVVGLVNSHDGTPWPLEGWVEGRKMTWTLTGIWNVDRIGESNHDLIPAEEGAQ